jgi:hypothetical protein
MADISIWQKAGHFYFALTPGYEQAVDNLEDMQRFCGRAQREGFQVARAIR